MIPNTLLANTLVIIAATLLSVDTSRADIAITARDVGKDVVFSYTGAIDLTNLGVSTPNSVRGTVYPANDIVGFGGPTAIPNTVDGYTSVITAAPDLGQGEFAFATSYSGRYFGVNQTDIKVPNGYVSGSPISGSMTFAKTKLSTMGFDISNAPFEWVLTDGQKVTLTFLTPLAASAEDLKLEVKQLEKKLKQLKKKLRKAKINGKTTLVRKLLKRIKSAKANLKSVKADLRAI